MIEEVTTALPQPAGISEMLRTTFTLLQPFDKATMVGI